MRTNKIIDATESDFDKAKETAITLASENDSQKAIDNLFYCTNLKEIEAGMRRLNDMANKTWLLSSILLYSLIYDKGLYAQSGLDWAAYSAQARERIGLDPRDISEQLSAARFFIQHHDAMLRYGWTPKEANRKLARAEMALELCKNIDEVLTHLASDSWKAFNEWYNSYKNPKKLKASQSEFIRKDIEIKKGKCYIGKIEAVKVSPKIPESDRKRLEEYIKQIFEAWQYGHELAIVSVYDKKEASIIPRLRDKYRQKK